MAKNKNKRSSSRLHELQEESSCFIPINAVENVKDQEITASVMRSLMGCTENKGAERGQRFKVQVESQEDSGSRLEQVFCDTVVQQLRIPGTGPRNKSSSVLNMVPLVPALAQVSGLIRSKKGAWNPGAYIKGMVLRGSDTDKIANDKWKLLAKAFAVSSDGGIPDRWACILDEKLGEMFEECIAHWDGKPDSELKGASCSSFQTQAFPSRAFAEDLHCVVDLEGLITRRQWISIIDSYLRLVLVSDLLWVGAINAGLRDELKQCFKPGYEVPLESAIGDLVLPSSRFVPIRIGAHAESELRKRTRDYIDGRLFLKCLLDILQEESVDLSKVNLNDSAGIRELLVLTKEKGTSEMLQAIKDRLQRIYNEEPDLMRITKSGPISSQFYWCCRYALGQRNTTAEEDRYFDQGYWVKKDGVHQGASWIFDPGPVALILFAHIACARCVGFSTASDFRRALQRYGVDVTEEQLTNGEVGNAMRSLGLVIDSPDAEGGMMIKSPFEREIP